jgi:hypothetical protein
MWGSRSGNVTQCSQVEVQRRLVLLAAAILLVTCLVSSSAQKFEVIRVSETSMNFYRNTRRHIPEDIILLSLHELRMTDDNWT